MKLSARLQSLSEAKRKLLIQRQPLSFSQRRLWFLERLYGDNTLYNGALLLRLRGDLDTAALARALGEITRRHRVLNTAFPEVDGQPVQWPLPWQPQVLPMLDLTRLPPTDAEQRARVLLDRANRRPFELAQGPMLLLQLLRLDARHHLLLFSAHHIVSDAWSQAVFVRETTVLYHAFQRGQPSPLPEPKLQYLDYARWQNKRLQGERLQQGLTWWRRHLHGVEPLELLSDRPRPARLSFHGKQRAFRLTASAARLDAVCTRLGMTPFMVGLSIFALLLERYSGRRSFLLGSVVAGRERVELEELIGFFAATLVLPWGTLGATNHGTGKRRIRSAVDLLEQGRRCVLAVQEHADIPFEMLVEQLSPQRDAARHPLFQVVFAVHNTPSEQLQLGDLQLEVLGQEKRTSRMDLLGTLETVEQSVFLKIEFSTELFDTTTVQRLAGHFDRLLETLLRQLEPAILDQGSRDGLPRSVEGFDLLSAAERAQLLRQWQDTERPRPASEGVHRRVYAQARHRPDAIALLQGHRHLSFGTLCRLATALAARLRQAWGDTGLGAERVLAVCLPRSPELVLAQLTILTTGAAFLQLDPALPPQRLRWLLADSGATGVLTQADLWQRLQDDKAASETCSTPRWFDVEFWLREDDTGSHETTAEAPKTSDPVHPVHPHNLAYLVYTSGSTGRPKGVEVSHGALTNLLDWYHSRFACSPTDRASQTFGLGFDGMVFEVWGHLSAGISLDLLDLRSLTATDFGRWLRRRAITLVMLITPLTEQLLRVPWPSSSQAGPDRRIGAGPRAILTGGDALHGPPPPGYPFTLFNLYGPTETAVIATHTPVPPAVPTPSSPATGLAPGLATGLARPSIGRPLDNLCARIVDARGRTVPIGVQGELQIGGASLARGYHDRPRRTAEAFVPDPWAETPGARLYRTGDLARFLPDGRIDFLGRRDHQVKIRGFRIEPGEVVSQLSRHPDVEAAAVLARQGGRSRDLRLEAFVVLRSSDEVASSVQPRLVAFLRADLPEYMTPAVWHFLDALPLTANQKVDRRGLEAIAAEAEASAETAGADTSDPDAVPAPRDDLELRVLHLWQELLPGQPHLHTDFFTAGGHSLLAVRLMAEVSRRFGVELPLSTLFDDGTPEAFAARLRSAAASGLGPGERPLCVVLQRSSSQLPAAQRRPLFLAHPVGGEVLCYLPLARRLADLCPVYGLQSPDLEVAELQGQPRIEDLAARYLDAVRQVQPSGPYRLAGWSMGGLVTFELARQLRRLGESVEWMVLLDVRAPSVRRADPYLQGDALRRVFEQDLAALASSEAHPGADLDAPFRRFAVNYQALYAYGRSEGFDELTAADYDGAVDYDGPLHVWRAADGANAAVSAPALGWAEQVAGRVHEATLPGDHYGILRPPHVEETARRLRALLRDESPSE